MLGKRRTRSGRIPYKRAVKKQTTVSNRSGNTISLPRLPFTWTNLIYCDFPYTLNPGAAGTAGVQVVSANGLYDVDITGVGHQPTGFDQFMALYNNYTVTEAEIEVTYFNSDTTNQQTVGISVQDLATTTDDVRRYIENGNCVSKMVGNATGAASNQSTLKMKVRLADFFRNRSILRDDIFQGTASTNPTEGLFFHVFAAPLDVTANASPVYARIIIRYKVMFRDPTLNVLS